MKKSVFIFLVLAISVAGGVFAQNSGFGRGFNLSPAQDLPGFGPGITPFQYTITPEMQAQAELNRAASKAGMLNMAFGLWSWKNSDTFGGILTAGLEAVGIGIAVTGVILLGGGGDDAGKFIFLPMIGGGVFAGGALFGYFRGASQYKKQNSVAWTGNPLDHISVALLPQDTGVSGSLTFKAAF